MRHVSAASTAPSSPARSPLVVLVHGAWHGAWCWAALQAELDRRAIPSLAIDLPGHGASTLPLADLFGDAQHVADVVAVQSRPVVLVGHSYGGAVITEAAARIGNAGSGPVQHLLYLCAFALDDGESIGTLLGSLPRVPVELNAAMRPGEPGTSVLDPQTAIPALYNSCPPEVARAAVERLSPQPSATFSQAVSGSPRASVASTYVVCTDDRSIAPEHQQAMAARCGTVVTLATDHSPFVSMVPETADVIAAALGHR
jgi:pimeloyl-ACP methyl ester carboxylesterase